MSCAKELTTIAGSGPRLRGPIADGEPTSNEPAATQIIDALLGRASVNVPKGCRGRSRGTFTQGPGWCRSADLHTVCKWMALRLHAAGLVWVLSQVGSHGGHLR